MAKKEPTNRDVLEITNKRFTMMLTELKKNDARFDLVFRQLTSLQERTEDIKNQQEADSETLDEVRGVLDSIAKAVDVDAITIVNHENRLAKLEKNRT